MLDAIELYKSFLNDPIVLQKFVQTRVHATQKIEQVGTFDHVSGADIDRLITCPTQARGGSEYVATGKSYQNSCSKT